MPQKVMEAARCEEPVDLVPFTHQVSGRAYMLLFDQTTVCKPLITREQLFYEAVPPELKEFVPEYRGVIEVTCHEDDDGYVTLVGYRSQYKPAGQATAHRPPSGSPSSGGEGTQSDSDSESTSAASSREQRRLRLRKSGSIEFSDSMGHIFEDADSNDGADVYLRAPQNPWSVRCHKKQLEKMRKAPTNKKSQKFILLENLTSNFEQPCILDLKMGTRIHGDDVPEDKKLRHIKKCAASTSSSLGLRIAGMQVYQSATGQYVCHNKYYGRGLTAEGVQEALSQFLNSGDRVRIDLIQPIIDRLRDLHHCLSKQNTFRFYSSSLLVMYDGADCDNTPDEDEEEDEHEEERMNLSSEEDSQVCDDSLEISVDELPAGAKSGVSTTPPSWHRHRRRRFVDTRMIDFAHTTHQGFKGDSTVHPGPDRGYLFGLENLIEMFRRLKETYT